jgi:hypothetical protein
LATFSSEPPPDSGHALSFYASLALAIEKCFFKFLCPPAIATFCQYVPVPWLSRHARETAFVFEELKLHMLEMISSTRDSVVVGGTSVLTKSALLRNLVEANMDGVGDSKRLTDEELLSNVFVRLLFPLLSFPFPFHFPERLFHFHFSFIFIFIVASDVCAPLPLLC